MAMAAGTSTSNFKRRFTDRKKLSPVECFLYREFNLCINFAEGTEHLKELSNLPNLDKDNATIF
jgi:hypothetical protein